MKKIENILSLIVRIIGIAVVGYLLVVSIFSTVYLSEYENVFFVKDSWIKNILVLASFTALVFWAKRYNSEKTEKYISKMAEIMSFVFPIILLLIVFTTQLAPKFDQRMVMQVANNMVQYNYSDFLPGGYAHRCDNQWGLILFYYGIFKLFGANNYITIQIINVIAISAMVIFIKKIIGLLFSKKTAELSYIAMCMFFPLWGYTTFIYGNYPAYALGFWGVYRVLKYICKYELQDAFSEEDGSNKTNTTQSYINLTLDVLLVSVIVGIAYVLKLYVIIVVIALAIICIFVSIKRKNLIPVLYIAGILVCSVLITNIVNNVIVQTTQIPHSGLPRSAQIAMGLHQGNDRPAGWYDGYIEAVFEENNYDHNAADKAAKEDIVCSIREFKINPVGFIGFIQKKIVSQWNEPTFESVFNMLNRDSALMTMPFWSKIFDNNRVNKGILELASIIHLLVLFGAFSYLFTGIKKSPVENDNSLIVLFPFVFFLGGFFFHIIWEASSQYTMIYFMMLIPYACCGYLGCVNKLMDKKNIITFALFVVLVFVLSLIPESSLSRLFRPTWNTQQYEEYRNEVKNEGVSFKTGRYYISSKEYPKKVITTKSLDSGIRLILSDKMGEDDRVILMSASDVSKNLNTNNLYSFRLQKSQLVFDVENGIVAYGSYIQQWEYNGDIGQQFTVVNTEDGYYYIVCGGLAVTSDEEGNLFLEEMKNADNQKWIFDK